MLASAVSLNEPGLLVTLRYELFDGYQRLKPRPYVPSPIRIVIVDEESLARIGQWPWSRYRLAELVDKLRAAGAAAIAFDMVFAEPDRTSPASLYSDWEEGDDVAAAPSRMDYDLQLAEAVAQGGVVTGFALVQGKGTGIPSLKSSIAISGDDPSSFLATYGGAVVTLPVIERAAAGNGALNVILDEDGIIRRVPLLLRLGNTVLPSLSAEALRVAQGVTTFVMKGSGAAGELNFGEHTGMTYVRIGAFTVPTDASGQVWIRFTRPEPSRMVPAWQVLEGQLAPDAFAGTIVLIGSTAAGLQDQHVTPLRITMAGVSLHAQVLEQILAGDFLQRPDWTKGAEVLLLIGLGLMILLLGRKLSALSIFAIAAGTTGLAFAASWYAFAHAQFLLDPVFPAAAAISVYILFSLLSHLHTESEQRWVRRAFASYVSPELVTELVNNPAQLALRGERRELTLLFTDLEGFTSLIERSEPSVIVPVINAYLDALIRIVFRYEGTVDKIVGDAVHVMFSAPIIQPDHAARAIACALELDTVARSFVEEQRRAGIAFGRTRIGVNSGSVIVGNFGGALRFDYTAHGDAVNTAARLESVNKYLGTRICVSEHTVAQCDDFVGRPGGRLVLKGKTEAIGVFEPLSAEERRTARISAYLEAYGLLDGDPSAARDAFADLAQRFPEDGLAAFHHRRLSAGETGSTVVLAEK